MDKKSKSVRQKVMGDSSDVPHLVIIADGWTKSLFNDLLSAGLLPEINDHLVKRGTYYKNVISVFPSVSLSSHATILTGSSPSEHLIPGHRWQYSEGHFRDYIGSNAQFVNGDMNTNVTTICEARNPLRSTTIQSVVTRGSSDVIRWPTLSSEKILNKAKPHICQYPDSTSVVWLPRGDAISHIYGPRSHQMKEEMRRTSRAIGSLASFLIDKGIYNSTKILFTSDHGQKSVSKICNLSKVFKSLNYSCQVNPKIRRNSDVVVCTNGDSSALVYLDNYFSMDSKLELLRILVGVRGIELGFLAVSATYHRVFSARGEATISVLSPNRIQYKVESGEDPLCLPKTMHGQVVDITAPRLDCNLDKYPDIIHQYLTSRVAGRSSDILLTSSLHHHFGKAPRIGWRLGFHRGSHGGATQDEILFPAVITGEHGPSVVEEPIRSESLLERFLDPQKFLIQERSLA